MATKEINHSIICAAPWTHLSLEPNSMLYTCCMATASPPLGKLDPKDPSCLEKVWNNDQLKDIRLKMLKGEKVSQCAPCYRLEGHGDISHRLFLNERFKAELPQLMQETTQTGEIESIPQFFGLRFSNVCNFACRICDSNLSTSWYQDDEKLGRAHPKGPVKVFDNLEQIENFFRPVINSLTWVYFAGGEPLISQEHHAFLHFLKRNNKRDVHLLYNTNLSTLGEGSRDVLSFWQGFKKITINASLDAVKERAEYLRYGQDWIKTESLLKEIYSSDLPLQVIYAPVISLHNIFHLPEYILHLIDNFPIGPDHFVLDPLTTPNYFSVQVLPKELKHKAKKELQIFQKELILQFGIEGSASLTKQVSALIKFMESDDHSHLWSEFMVETKRVDDLREQSFIDIFPEFIGFF